MSEIYCGIGKIPSKSRLGSMKECAEKKQVKYWGVKKIDAKLLEVAKGSKKDEGSRVNVLKEMAKYRGRVSKLKKALAAAKTKEDKAKYQKELDVANVLFTKFEDQFTAMEKKRMAEKKRRCIYTRSY